MLAAELARQIAALPEGARFTLPGGVEGPVVATVKRPGVTLLGTPDSSPLRSLLVTSTQDVTVRGVRFDLAPDAATTTATTALRITKCRHVTVEDCALTGGTAVAGVDLAATPDAPVLDRPVIGRPTGTAVGIDTSSDVALARLEVSGFHMGVGASHVDGFTLTDSRIHGLRTTPIRGGSVSRVRIVGNRLWGLAPVRSGPAPDHYDFIHLWTNRGDLAPATDIAIADNLMDQGDGPAAIVINIEDNSGQGFFALVLQANRSISSAHQAYRLEHVLGGAITDNVILQNGGGPKDTPGVNIVIPPAAQASAGIRLGGNVAPDAFGNLDPATNTVIPPGPVPAWTLDQLRAAWLR